MPGLFQIFFLLQNPYYRRRKTLFLRLGRAKCLFFYKFFHVFSCTKISGALCHAWTFSKLFFSPKTLTIGAARLSIVAKEQTRPHSKHSKHSKHIWNSLGFFFEKFKNLGRRCRCLSSNVHAAMNVDKGRACLSAA